jgi:hypothetical protein
MSFDKVSPKWSSLTWSTTHVAFEGGVSGSNSEVGGSSHQRVETIHDVIPY